MDKKIWECLYTKDQFKRIFVGKDIPSKGECLYISFPGNGQYEKITKSDKKSTYGKPLWLVELFQA